MRSRWSILSAGAGAVSLSFLLAVTNSHDVRGDTTTQGSGSEAAPSPAPTGGAEADAPPPPQKDPFAPYDVGGPEAIWPYESLTPAEQAVIDRNRSATGWRQVHDGFGTAVLERSKKAQAEAAEHELGVDNLELTGVVP
jgi:hypothetical protein